MNPLLFFKPIPLPHGDGYVFVPPAEIIFVQGMHNGCKVYCLNARQPYLVSYTMQEMIDQVPEDLFCRVHRSYTISLYHIRRSNKQHTRIFFSNDLFAPVSETYRQDFLNKGGFCGKDKRVTQPPVAAVQP